MNKPIELTAGVSGRYVLDIYNVDTGETRNYEFDNLITDQGLDYLTNQIEWARFCSVGTSSTAPTNGDTQLSGFVASAEVSGYDSVAGNFLDETIVYNTSSPYDSQHQGKYVFGLGAAAGNLSELGIGLANNGTSLFSRALIKDGAGNPTTITILSNEILTVTYILTVFPPLTDVTGTINGYDYVARASYVTRAGGTGDQIGAGWSFAFNVVQGWDKRRILQYSARTMFVLYSGGIGAIDSGPSGTSAAVGNVGTITNDAYTLGSRTRNFSRLIGTGNGNITFASANIITGVGCYQVSFNPAVAKDNTKEFTFGYTLSWNRV